MKRRILTEDLKCLLVGYRYERNRLQEPQRRSRIPSRDFSLYNYKDFVLYTSQCITSYFRDLPEYSQVQSKTTVYSICLCLRVRVCLYVCVCMKGKKFRKPKERTLSHSESVSHVLGFYSNSMCIWIDASTLFESPGLPLTMSLCLQSLFICIIL